MKRWELMRHRWRSISRHILHVEGELERLLNASEGEQRVHSARHVEDLEGLAASLDFSSKSKIHGTAEELKSRLIFGSCMVRNGLMRSLLCKLFESTIQAPLNTYELEQAFMEVKTTNGKVGFCVINAQPITAALMAVLMRDTVNCVQATAPTSSYLGHARWKWRC